MAIVRPYQAGRMLGEHGWFLSLLLLVLAIAPIAGCMGFCLWLFNEMDSRWSWLFWQPTTVPSVWQRILIVLESLAEPGKVWVLLATCLGSLAFVSGFVVGASAVAWVRVSRTDSIFAAARRAWQCCYATTGIGLLGMLVTCLTAIITQGPALLASGLFFVALAVPTTSILYLSIIVRVADGRCPPPPPETDEPICEGCGYDLTAARLEDRCPECGRPVAESLDPAQARKDEAWTLHRDFADTFMRVLTQPSAFYRSLRVRRPLEDARVFAGLNGAMLFAGGLLAAMGFVALMTGMHGRGPDGLEVLLMLPIIAMWTVALCQWVHGALASLALLLLRIGNRLPDDRWFAHAVCYEWPFAWVLAGFWGVSLGLFGAFETPFATLLGIPGADFLWLMFGTLGVSFRWLLRYFSLARAIRWANS